jgi:hypothetical protein
MTLSKHGRASPLRCWRTCPPADIVNEHVNRLRKELTRRAELNCSTWIGAGGVDAAVAIRMALDSTRRGEADGGSFDAIMSALLICAAEGDAAAIVVLAYVLRRTGDPPCILLSSCWIRRLAELARARDRRSIAPISPAHATRHGRK